MKYIHTDPRTKLFVLLICAVAITISPSLYYEGGLVFVILLYGILSGKPKYSIIMAIIYGGLLGLAIISNFYLSGALRIMFTTFSDFIGKMFPCVMMGGILVGTTQASEFMAALNHMHIPKNVVVPVTVMLRYIPMIQEDWGYIKDSMKLRDVAPSLKGLIKNPSQTVECIYVPLMMAASKMADEISAAAVTRGIENPKPRTCVKQIHFCVQDIIVAVVFVGYFLTAFL
ncbi:Energy-coupling factor transporter transmembrane protein EcfT [Clostridiales bacterium CHKCI001]|nr:Energy-coupling factor transporter transmembrane protein EcfT [Clostridiales bacterium CHKCI001]